MEFSTAVKYIGEVSGRKEKESRLRNILTENVKFLELLERTYNPRRVYGVRKFPDARFGNKTLSLIWDDVLTLLDRLESRVITGKAALNEVLDVAEQLRYEEQEVLKTLFKGDLRCGMSSGTINRVAPGTIPEYPYMRCSLIKSSNIAKFEWDKGVFSQIKADGMFVNIDLDKNGVVSYSSRSGSAFPAEKFANITKSVERLFPCMRYTGEIVVQDKDENVMPREIGNGMLNSVLKGGDFDEGCTPVVFLWDYLPLSACIAKGTYDVPYGIRFELLSDRVREAYAESMNVAMIPSTIVYSLEEALKDYTNAIAQGMEGTVIKCPKSIWKDGTSKDQIKMKIEAEVDLVVVGYREGNGKNQATFGSLICETSEGALQVAVSGFKDEERLRIFNELEQWIEEKRIITVRSNAIMRSEDKQHSLFLPRYVEERLDKNEADSFEKVVEIFNNLTLV